MTAVPLFLRYDKDADGVCSRRPRGLLESFYRA